MVPDEFRRPVDFLNIKRMQPLEFALADRVVREEGILSGILEAAQTRVVFGKKSTSDTNWYHISFSQSFSSAPTVHVTGEHREGWFNPIAVRPGYLDPGNYANYVGNNAKDRVTREVSIPVIDWALGNLAYWMAYVPSWVFAELLNSSFGFLAGQTQDASNAAAGALHQASGLPQMLHTPASIKNVSASGFDLLGVPDANFHWLAIGKR